MKKKQIRSESNSEIKLPDNDHRLLGQKLGLFSFHESAPGAPFWHHKGMVLFRELERYARTLNDQNGYQEISTPLLVKKELFEQSGHWEHYRDNMFWFENPRDKNETIVLKPMNCPESTVLYNTTIRSHKDLPLRFAEIGRLYRNELSGTLGGLFRVRQITMDDAHIYVRPDQVEDEIARVIAIIENFYRMLGFMPRYVLATRPKDALGTAQDWECAEEALAGALSRKKILFTTEQGEGAFYGPKIEVHMQDSQSRDWQLGTVQLDLIMLPKKFNLSYIDEHGKKQMPWVIHRAIFGSFERFIGIMLEHFNGVLPVWLAPIQIGILSITDEAKNYCHHIHAQLRAHTFRVFVDDRSETIGKKIREAELQKIPFLLIIGEKEIQSQTVAVREHGKGDHGAMPLEQFIEMITSTLT